MKKNYLSILLKLPAIYACMLITVNMHAQDAATKKISGRVVNEKGEGLSSVSIRVGKKAGGTASDTAGYFQLIIPAKGVTLTFSYVGYKEKEIFVKDNEANLVVLQAEVKDLQNVVVIGYGSVKKKDLTGSVVSVKGDEIKAIPVTTFDQALQGRAAGVQVVQNTGKPGGEASVRIRGTTSINAGNEPLYVVDGLVINSSGADVSTGITRGPRVSPLAAINPSDIESIEILKDASATAIYGSRGANGVVIITTKRGRAGTGTVSFEAYYAVQEIANKLDLLNASQFGDLVNEAKLNAGKTPVYVNPKNLGEGTDWQDELFRRAPMASYSIAFTGGDDKTKYAVSGNYFTQDGIIISSDFKRYSFRANLDRDVNTHISVGSSASYVRVTSTGVLTNAGTIVPGDVTSALLFNPILPVYDSTVKGGYTFQNDRGPNLGNPIADAKEYTSYGITSRFIGNIYAKYKFSKSLEIKTSFGLDGYDQKDNSFGPNYLKRTQASQGEASVGTSRGQTWLWENTLSYNKWFNGDHNLNVVAGQTVQQFQNEYLLAFAFDFPDDRTGYHDISAGLDPQKPINGESQWSLISYLARANYTFKNKYLFTLTGRVDGSSKFAPGNKYGFFPSGAFAWRISSEPFMDKLNWVSDMKFRTSYGVVGNQAIPPYQSLALIGAYGEGVFNSASGSEIYTGLEPLSYTNENLKWETTAQFDAGIDVSLFKERIALTVDYYNKKTSDLLLSTPIPSTTGFTSTVLNVGNISNKGFDIDLRTTNIDGKFKWNTALNFSINKNRVDQLSGDDDILFITLLRVGEPIGTFYGYKFKGIFQTDSAAANSPVLVGQERTAPNPASWARAGDRQYEDINGDSVIDANDRVVLGSAQPKFTWGFNNTFSYKGFDLSIFIQGSQGNKMLNNNNIDLVSFSGQNNVLADAGLNRWTPEHPSDKYPRALSNGSLDYGVSSSFYVEDASYIRVKNISLGYTLPQSVARKLKMQNCRIYASATNVFTITDYTGYDPEANTYGQSSFLIGVDQGGYPQAKVYTAGVNITF